MKQIEVLTAFGIGKPNTTERMHAKTLSEIFAMIASMLCNIMSVVIESREFHFGQIWGTPIYRDAKPFSEGTKMEGEKWIVKTKTGTYSFSLPTGNLFYFAFCDLLKDFVPGYMKKEIQADITMVLDGLILNEVKKAMSLIRFDELRASMNNVHLTFKGRSIEIVGTDGHKLYVSESDYAKITMRTQPMPKNTLILLLPFNELKKAIQVNKSKLVIELVFNGKEISNGFLNGVKFEHCNDKPIEYKNIIPKYQEFVEVNIKELIEGIKQVLPTANKFTNKIDFHFNGQIDLHTHDLDFKQGTDVRINYVQKTNQDYEISFNGKYLLECLNTMNDKKALRQTVKIYSNGRPNKAVMFDSNCLLMPITGS